MLLRPWTKKRIFHVSGFFKLQSDPDLSPWGKKMSPVLAKKQKTAANKYEREREEIILRKDHLLKQTLIKEYCRQKPWTLD